MPPNLPFRPPEQGVSAPPQNHSPEVIQMLHFLRLLPAEKPGIIANNFGGRK
jgi:hypothetical protein